MGNISPAQEHERQLALQMIFRHLPKAARRDRVDTTVAMIERGEFDPAGMLVSRDGERMTGAIACVSFPGAVGMCWPPAVVTGESQNTLEDELIKTGIANLQLRGAKLVQCLLVPDEISLAQPLLRNGFNHVTQLQYLAHSLSRVESTPIALDVVLHHYHEHVAMFHKTLMASYRQSLDFPELDGSRSVEEIIEGHRAFGEYDAERWLLAMQHDRAVGVLLLTELSHWEGWELSYVGIVPEERGKGIGQQLTRWALCQAAQAGASQLTLAVDARNTPARKLYQNLGFHQTAKREVLLRFLTAQTSQNPGQKKEDSAKNEQNY